MPRKVFVAGEILTAADVNTNLMDQAVMVFDDSAARGSAIPSPIEGMLTYLKDTDELEKYTTDWVQAATPPAILQVVTATDTTQRSTTSGTYADASISVSITPQSASSTLYVTWIGQIFLQDTGGSRATMDLQITDSSNVALQGAERARFTSVAGVAIRGEAVESVTGVVAATDTSARTYKLRFRRDTGANAQRLDNDQNTGRMIVMEMA